MMDVFLVDDDLDVATSDEIVQLEAAIGTSLPRSYVRFLTSYGEGTLGGFLWIKGVDRVLKDRRYLADTVDENGGFWWPASAAVLARAAAAKALPVAISNDGDEVIIDPATGGLFVLPRHREVVFAIPAGFDDPLRWPTDYLTPGASPPTFMPDCNLISVEMVPRGAVPPLAEQEQRFAAVLCGGPDDHIRRQIGASVVIHSRHSRSRLQLSGRIHLSFNGKYPALPTEAIRVGEAMGFAVT